MTFFGLAYRNAWRKPGRTILLIISVAIAFLIYVVLQSFLVGAHGNSTEKNRLVVVNQTSARQSLPYRYLADLDAMNGVEDVAFTARMRGFVNTENNIAVLTAVDADRTFSVFGTELALTPAMMETLTQDRQNLLVGQMLARSMGWSVGDRVSITAFKDVQRDGNRTWSFDVSGIFEGETASVDTYFAIMQYDYFNSARQQGLDTVNNYIVVPSNGVEGQSLAPKIDALFANSPNPTRTQAEKQFLQSFMRQIADIRSVVTMVVSAALVTILLIVVNTMAFAVRERTFEIGVLKTIGLSGKRIMSLILSESLLVFAIGGTLGSVVGWLICLLADPAIGLVFTNFVATTAGLLIVALGLVSGLLPALNAMRLPIVQAFKAR
ncbi:FtsX-like permease family protein [Pseudovibrio sp. Tun.PSC04-5.I4]|uniref:ABC transporter permease n=1 Tax=Pseudovibrio sp. Tun.PSC04-5.I4 TaxID=1798213 RepID=UPI0008857D44|nr:FtsX-like permease family protein [Pseudovibrio sp. Tun.PSC04-5.I4]SDR47063.1 putative ABC transport system permease protein [Pseudovibrio sp. Tun.PSC04-5.I4]